MSCMPLQQTTKSKSWTIINSCICSDISTCKGSWCENRMSRSLLKTYTTIGTIIIPVMICLTSPDHCPGDDMFNQSRSLSGDVMFNQSRTLSLHCPDQPLSCHDLCSCIGSPDVREIKERKHRNEY